MTSMRRRYVASTSLRRHVSAGNLASPWPPNILNLGPLNILNLPTPMSRCDASVTARLRLYRRKGLKYTCCCIFLNWFNLNDNFEKYIRKYLISYDLCYSSDLGSFFIEMYSRTSVARTLMADLPRLCRTCA